MSAVAVIFQRGKFSCSEIFWQQLPPRDPVAFPGHPYTISAPSLVPFPWLHSHQATQPGADPQPGTPLSTAAPPARLNPAPHPSSLAAGAFWGVLGFFFAACLLWGGGNVLRGVREGCS